MVPLLMETVVALRKLETKEMSVTEVELKSLLLRKKKTGWHLEGTELNWLCALKREKYLTKIKESAEMGKAPNKTQSEHFNWSSIAKQGGDNPIRETTLGRAVEKLENGLCRRNVDFTKETGNCLEEIEKRESLSGSDHSRCFEIIASRMFGKIGEIAVVDVLGYDFPGLAMLYDGNGSGSGGCNVLDQVQANRWAVCDAKSLGLRMSQVTPSTEIRERTNCVCAEDVLQMLDCFCCCKRQSCRESGRKNLWWYN